MMICLFVCFLIDVAQRGAAEKHDDVPLGHEHHLTLEMQRLVFLLLLQIHLHFFVIAAVTTACTATLAALKQ